MTTVPELVTEAGSGAERLWRLARGGTFDDFLLSPRKSLVERRDPTRLDLSCRLTRRLGLERPIVSANMDTVTRAPMAIVMAEEGGLGVIDRGFKPGDIGPQAREVEIVKRRQHGVIPDPYTIDAGASLESAAEVMRRSGVGTLVVVDESRRLAGLLTERDMRFVDASDPSARVADRMTPVESLVVHEGPLDVDDAERVMVARKVKKLPLVDRSGRLTGLITARDLVRQRQLPFSTRDPQGRLRVGAAIGATGDYLERAAELHRLGADVLVIDIAHGHSTVMERALTAFRRRFPNVPPTARDSWPSGAWTGSRSGSAPVAAARPASRRALASRSCRHWSKPAPARVTRSRSSRTAASGATVPLPSPSSSAATP